MKNESSKLDTTSLSKQAIAPPELIGGDHVTISLSESVNAPTRSTKTSRHRIIENFIVVWLDSNIDQSNSDFEHFVTQFRAIVNSIDTFTSTDECADFLTDIKDEKAFLIVSGALGQHFVPLIHDWLQLSSIYVLCDKTSQNEQWVKDCNKVKGVFTQIKPICDSLKRETHQWDHNLQPISIVSPNRDLNELDPLFMYSQLLKEILLTMDHDERAKNELVELFRELFNGNESRLKIVDEFEREYHLHSPVWWYTRECFIYYILNRALRMLEVDIVIKMGFFLRDLHQQIEQLHNETLGSRTSFTVYRGQGISNSEFEKMRNSNGGLLSFNSFLSTSIDRQVSFSYAESAGENRDLTGILFRIQINPALTSTPYASLNNISYFESAEEEVLFSMHTVFRIGDIEQIGDRVWQVELILTSDDDEQLRALTEHVRAEIGGGAGWYRLGNLMIKIGAFDKAEEIYQTLLKSIKSDSNGKELANIYNQLGSMNNLKADYKEALYFYRKGLEIIQQSLPLNHTVLATIYNNIGSVNDYIEEYPTALEFYQKALEEYQTHLPPNHPHLAVTYGNIGTVYRKMEQYSTALEFYRKALEIAEKSLPPNHPWLAITYNKIGQVHESIAEYSTAIDFYQKTLQIYQKSLPPNHLSLATTYSDIGSVHHTMGDYPAALEFYRKALEIEQKSLPLNHPNLASTYGNIGRVHDLMSEYASAVDFYQKTLEIQEKSLHPNHPDLIDIYGNIGFLHTKMGNYSTALEIYQMTLEICQKSLPPNHSSLATTYTLIGGVHELMSEYPTALEFYQKTLEIEENSLLSNHSSQAITYINIGRMHDHMGEYSTALSFYQKAAEMQNSFPPNYPDLAVTYNCIGFIYDKTGEYSTALEFYQKTLHIQQKCLPLNHVGLAETYYNMARVFKCLERYEKAAEHAERAMEIVRQSSLPSNHADIVMFRQTLDRLYEKK